MSQAQGGFPEVGAPGTSESPVKGAKDLKDAKAVQQATPQLDDPLRIRLEEHESGEAAPVTRDNPRPAPSHAPLNTRSIKKARQEQDAQSPDHLADAETGSVGSTDSKLGEEDGDRAVVPATMKGYTSLSSQLKSLFPWWKYGILVGGASMSVLIDVIYTGFLIKTIVEGVDYTAQDTSADRPYFTIPLKIILSLICIPNAPCDVGAIDWCGDSEEIATLRETPQDKGLREWVGSCRSSGRATCAWVVVKFFTYLLKTTAQLSFASLGSSDAIVLAWFISQVAVRWGVGAALTLTAIIYYNLFTNARREEGILAYFKALTASCKDGMLYRGVMNPLMTLESVIEIFCNVGYRTGITVYLDWKLFTEVLGFEDGDLATEISMIVGGSATALDAGASRTLQVIAKNLDKRFADITPEELEAGKLTVTRKERITDAVMSGFRGVPLLTFFLSRGVFEEQWKNIGLGAASSLLVTAHAYYAKTTSRNYRAAVKVKENGVKVAQQDQDRAVGSSPRDHMAVDISPSFSRGLDSPGLLRSPSVILPLISPLSNGFPPTPSGVVNDPAIETEQETDDERTWEARRAIFDELAQRQREKSGGKNFILTAVAISRLMRYLAWIFAAMELNEELAGKGLYGSMAPFTRDQAASLALVTGAQTFLQNELDYFIKQMTDVIPKQALRWKMESAVPYTRTGACCCAPGCCSCCETQCTGNSSKLMGMLSAFFRPASQYTLSYLGKFREKPALLDPAPATPPSAASEEGASAGLLSGQQKRSRNCCIVM